RVSSPEQAKGGDLVGQRQVIPKIESLGGIVVASPEYIGPGYGQAWFEERQKYRDLALEHDADIVWATPCRARETRSTGCYFVSGSRRPLNTDHTVEPPGDEPRRNTCPASPISPN